MLERMFPFKTVPGKYGPAETAIVLLHMQPGFLQDYTHAQQARLIDAQHEILGYAATSGMRTVALEMPGEGSTMPSLAAAIQQSRGTTLSSLAEDVFTDPQAYQVLQSWGTCQAIIMGINASACVIDTALGATYNGVVPGTAQDIIADPPGRDRVKYADWFRGNGFYYRSAAELVADFQKK